MRVEDGVGHFRLGQLWPGPMTINVPGAPLTVEVTGTRADLRIDLDDPSAQPARKPRRTVVFTFRAPAGSPPPTGAVAVLAQDVSDRPDYPRVQIQDGRAAVEVVVPNVITYAPQGTVGYWFPETSGVRVEPGGEPLEIAVPVLPAGARRFRRFRTQKRRGLWASQKARIARAQREGAAAAVGRGNPGGVRGDASSGNQTRGE